MILFHGELFPGIHEPAVTTELWQEVNDLLTARRLPTRPRGQGRPPAGKHIFYKGTLKCICGESLVPRTNKRKAISSDKVYVYEHYSCYGRSQDKASCPVLPIRRELIDSPVFRYFERVGLDLEATRDQLAAAQGRRATETRALLVGAERDAQKAGDRLARVEARLPGGRDRCRRLESLPRQPA